MEKVDYKTVWKEHKEWVEKSIEYLKTRQEETDGKEKERIKNKKDGINVALQHMEESEKIYEL